MALQRWLSLRGRPANNVTEVSGQLCILQWLSREQAQALRRCRPAPDDREVPASVPRHLLAAHVSQRGCHRIPYVFFRCFSFPHFPSVLLFPLLALWILLCARFEWAWVWSLVHRYRCPAVTQPTKKNNEPTDRELMRNVEYIRSLEIQCSCNWS